MASLWMASLLLESVPPLTATNTVCKGSNQVIWGDKKPSNHMQLNIVALYAREHACKCLHTNPTMCFGKACSLVNYLLLGRRSKTRSNFDDRHSLQGLRVCCPSDCCQWSWHRCKTEASCWEWRNHDLQRLWEKNIHNWMFAAISNSLGSWKGAGWVEAFYTESFLQIESKGCTLSL